MAIHLANNNYEELFSSIKEVMKNHVQPTAVERDLSASYPLDLVQKVHATGMFNAFVPRSHGGLGMSLHEICQLYFECARHSLDLAWLSSIGASSVIAVDLINKFATDKVKDEIFGSFAKKPVQFCIANSENGAGSNPVLMRSAVVEENGRKTLLGRKDCVTNATVADHFLVSAKRLLNDKPMVDVFLLPRSQVKVVGLEHNLMGFRTSSTGEVNFSIPDFDPEAHLMGQAGAGFSLFRRCFDMERLILSAEVAGLLQGLEDQAVAYIQSKETAKKGFSSNQYIQQKLLVIFSAKEKIWSLVERVARQEDLSKSNQLLSLMKLLSIRDGLEGSLAYFELLGHNALASNNLAQKIVRDLVATRFFGGTIELQKISMFTDFGVVQEKATDTKKKAS